MRFLPLAIAAICNLGFANILGQPIDFNQISEHCPEAILFETEERVYLAPEKIRVTEQGIFVGDIPIPTLSSDATGCWFQKPPQDRYWRCRRAECPNYGRVYYNPTGKCPYCGITGNPA